ncbi:MAG: acyl-CoA thioesterase [Candidatus Kapabacteria bacterium]|nr:acyl-CoA thioesterase [Candidatus Kapabacteria bacterium]
MYSTFVTEIQIRPDDIDMNNHVHNTRYLDYVLAARYDQMQRCYGMGMDEFLIRGYTWVNTKATIEYKRQMRLGDTARVNTHIVSMNSKGCSIRFAIHSAATGKLCCEGTCDFVMLDTTTGKPATLPHDVIERYSV